MVRSPRGTRWLITINNPSEAEKVKAAQFCIEAKYGILCREIGKENEQPHIHFFVILHADKACSVIKSEFPRARIDKFKGDSSKGRDYCKKDGDFDEYGSFPDKQGKRTEFDKFRDWCLEHDRIPTERDIALEWPSLYGRYRSNCLRMLSLLRPRTPRQLGSELREWQSELKERFLTDPDDRTVEFLVDDEGNKGKSWFCQHMMSERFDDVQIIGVGKRDDLAHVIDEQKTIFLLDVPRDQLQFLNYSILEMLKNGLVFSPKYESRVKLLHNQAHVCVFCNEQPDLTKLSEDRYKITNL